MGMTTMQSTKQQNRLSILQSMECTLRVYARLVSFARFVWLFEVVEECGQTFECGFALVFDFDAELHFGLGDAAQVDE